ncbi:MAG TPA: hypothetical protein VJ961_03155 [Mariprofundaceae bacterium]|nr:hypothetical protein [Mariprofundaceae bacterium]
MIRPVGRLGLVAGLFVSALLLHRVPAAIIELLLVWGLLRLITGSYRIHFQAWRLLRWLIIPVFILHLFFTPGTLMFPGSVIPLTVEGMEMAVWLSLRLALLFYAALLLSRALSVQEWIGFLSAIPFIGPRMRTYLYLFIPMYHVMRNLTGRYREMWLLRGRRRALGILLATMLEEVMRVGSRLADSLWLRWDDGIRRLDLRVDALSATCIGAGGCCIALAWFV